jgi:excisionase family DNA binding protein
MSVTETVRGPAEAWSYVADVRPRRLSCLVPRAVIVPRRMYWRRVGGSQSLLDDGADRDSNAVTPVVLTVPEACAMLRISRWTLYELIRSRQLETVKIGSRRVIPVAAIRAFIDRVRGGETA